MLCAQIAVAAKAAILITEVVSTVCTNLFMPAIAASLVFEGLVSLCCRVSTASAALLAMAGRTIALIVSVGAIGSGCYRAGGAGDAVRAVTIRLHIAGAVSLFTGLLTDRTQLPMLTVFGNVPAGIATGTADRSTAILAGTFMLIARPATGYCPAGYSMVAVFISLAH